MPRGRLARSVMIPPEGNRQAHRPRGGPARRSMTDVHDEGQRKILNRLKRLEGQVRGLQRMIEEERECRDVLTLLAGVRKALDATGDLVLTRYLEASRTELRAGEGNVEEILTAVRLARG